MAILSGEIITRVIKWGKRPADIKSYRKWPKNMLPYLERQFYLHPREMASLQYISCPGWLGRLPVHYIRLYDRIMADQQNIVIKHHSDLDKYPDLIRFEGHIFSGGKIYLRKKRVHIN
ncbi:MAG: hypothetical protein JSW16_03745 [Dehalococcoidales bacterium]|nr:MAG: hypothetical protein JSW16_03745 [Dehalococcoidales bacterium]